MLLHFYYQRHVPLINLLCLIHPLIPVVYRDWWVLAPTFKAGIKRKKKGVWEFSTGAQHVTPVSAEVSEHLSSSSQLKVILTNVWVSRLLLGRDCHSGLHKAAAGGSSPQGAALPTRSSRARPRAGQAEAALPPSPAGAAHRSDAGVQQANNFHINFSWKTEGCYFLPFLFAGQDSLKMAGKSTLLLPHPPEKERNGFSDTYDGRFGCCKGKQNPCLKPLSL